MCFKLHVLGIHTRNVLKFQLKSVLQHSAVKYYLDAYIKIFYIV